MDLKKLDLNEQVSIESLILANHVEAANGLLYVSGGGWTTHTRQASLGGPPALSHLGVALIVAIPWNQTNRDHRVMIEFRDEDANQVGNITAQMNVGRLPGMRPGTMQYFPIALSINMSFPHTGGYELVAHVEGIDGSERRWTFQVQDIQPLAATA